MNITETLFVILLAFLLAVNSVQGYPRGPSDFDNNWLSGSQHQEQQRDLMTSLTPATVQDFVTRLKRAEKMISELTKVSISLVSAPKVRLFSGPDKTGSHEDYNVAPHHWNVDCYDLLGMSGNVRSVDTFDSCVRLYSKTGCTGDSTTRLPFSTIAADEVGLQVRSVGPCSQLPATYHQSGILSRAFGR